MGTPFETSRGSRSVITVLVFALVACGATQGPAASGGTSSGGKSSGGKTSGGARRTSNVCPPSSVVTSESCPTRPVPPGNGSSTDGCKSDADCKEQPGGDGRCIKNPVFGLDLPPRGAGQTNLLAGPPPPPRHSICVYDVCHTNADCGGGARCNCGSGQGAYRNGCTPLDQCLADRDCPENTICNCGGGYANLCVDGDCRTDGDCASGFACESSHCHTPQDSCHSTKDCPSTESHYLTCGYDGSKRAWACHEVLPVPPG